MANQPKRAFHTASEPEIKAGQVSDVYFQRTIQILKATVDFALARPDLADAFRAYLKSLPL